MQDGIRMVGGSVSTGGTNFANARSCLCQTAIIEYAGTVFASCNAKIQEISEDNLDKTYLGISDYGYDTAAGSVWADPSKESTIAQDLMFHSNHSSRHLGMMEGLRGLLGRAGTISV